MMQGKSLLGSRPKKKSEQTGVALRVHYFTPTEAAIPPVGSASLRTAHFPIAVNQPPPASIDSSTDVNKSELDGFLLLDLAGVGFPEDVEHLSIVEKKLRTVIEEDLTYFSELQYLDVSENNLPFPSFGALPKLRELRIACNAIRDIPDDLLGFGQLMYLDLSYNQLTKDSIAALAGIPLLKELDLSGNALQELPSSMYQFTQLDKLILQYNKLEDNSLFNTFGTIPTLRSLDLSHNYFSRIPASACEGDKLRFLDTLDISFNYFTRDVHIEPLIQLPRIVTIMLYGNPMLGPTGEDPMFVYIEDLIDQAHAVRDAQKSTIPDIEFITEVPRRRILKKGQPLGRFALYRDFSMVQVDGSVSTKSNREWRKQGTQTLFAESIANQRRQQVAHSLQQQATHLLSAAASAPDLTFLTAVQPTTAAASRLVSNKLLNTDSLADEVMANVAQEMGLINSLDLQILEEHAQLPPSLLTQELQRMLNASEDYLSPYREIKNETKSPVEEGYPEDRVPGKLLSVTIAEQGVPPSVSAQPIALKTAMKALQRAIDQPLTDYNEVPAKFSHGSSGTQDYHKPTALTLQRQRARIVRPQPVDEPESSYRHDSVQLATAVSGLPQPTAYKQMRVEHRQKTLEQIDDVLEKLNNNSTKIAQFNPILDAGLHHDRHHVLHNPYQSEIDPEQEEEEELELEEEEAMYTNANAKHNPHAQSGLTDMRQYHVNVQKTQAQQSTTQLKQSLDRMRTFAKPSGVTQLMAMVDDIVNEFNS